MDAGRQSIRLRCQGTRKLMVDLPLRDRAHEKRRFPIDRETSFV